MPRFRAFLVVALLGACLQGDGGRSQGSRCDVDADCHGDLVCAYGLCRPVCLFDQDCPEGQVCVASDESGEAVCTVEQDAEPCAGVECRLGQHCVDGECVHDACADCEGRVCGDNGCGGLCGPGCDVGQTCSLLGQCESCPATTPVLWIAVEGGTFLMGSPSGEVGRVVDSWDQEMLHEVTLTHDFEILRREVTQDEFAALMGTRPSSHADCATCPVESVSWHEAAAYCNALSRCASLPLCYECVRQGADVACEPAGEASPYACEGFRLPTDAELEMAARAGETRATQNGDLDETQLECEAPNPVLDSIAWFCGNSGGSTHPVESLEPNALGLYDVLGNVREYCHDLCRRELGYDPVVDPWGPRSGFEGRVVRGGAWTEPARRSRLAFRARSEADPDDRYDDVGFRVARTLF